MSTLNSVIGALRANLSLDSAKFTQGLNQARGKLKTFQTAFQGFEGRLGATFKKLAAAAKVAFLAMAAAVAGAAAGVAASTVKLAANAKEIDRVSKSLGMSASSYQTITGAASKFGIEQDKINDIIKDSNEKLGEFIATGGGGFKDFMEQVASPQGVSAEDLIKLPPEERFVKMQALMDKQNLTLEQQSFYWESIASDATYLIPMLNKGGAELEKIKANLIATGAILSDSVIANLTTFSSSLTSIGTTMKGWNNILVSASAPQLADLSSRIASFLQTNEGIRTFFADMGANIAASLQFVIDRFDQIVIGFRNDSSEATTFGSIVNSITSIFDKFSGTGASAFDKISSVFNILMSVADFALYAINAVIPSSETMNSVFGETTNILAGLETLFSDMATWGKVAVDGIVGAFSNFPALIGDLFYSAVNAALTQIENLINGVLSRVSKGIAALKDAPRQIGNWANLPWQKDDPGMIGPQQPAIGPISMPRVANPNEGAMRELGETIAESIDTHTDAAAREAIQSAIANPGLSLNRFTSNPALNPAPAPSTGGAGYTPSFNTPVDTGSGGGGGGGGKGAGAGGGGKGAGAGGGAGGGKKSEAEREAESQKKAYESLQERVKTLGTTLGMTGLQQRIFNEQQRIGTAASPEAVAALVEQEDKLQKYKETVDFIKNSFKETFASVLTGASSAKEAFGKMLTDMANRLINSGLDKLMDSIFGSLAGGAGGGFGNILGSVLGAFTGSPVVGTDALSNSLRAIPGFAKGTNGSPSGLALVGERGPELMNLRGGTQIFNAKETEALRSGGGAITVNVNATIDDGVKLDWLNQSKNVAINTTRQGISEFQERQLPGAMRAINKDSGRR